MGELQSIGYNGQPVQQAFRPVDPPIAVLVDLAALFPREPHRAGGYNPAGLQMHSVVEGRLTCWGICEQGHWWGLVTYDDRLRPPAQSVTHWIPAWMLKRKTDRRYRGHRRPSDSSSSEVLLGMVVVVHPRLAGIQVWRWDPFGAAVFAFSGLSSRLVRRGGCAGRRPGLRR